MLARLRMRFSVALGVFQLTCMSLAIALPAAYLITYWRFGGDLSQSKTGWDALRLALGVTLVECGAICPAVAYPSVKMLRTVNALRDRLHALASLDPLTGLLNRRGFDEAVSGIPHGAPVAAVVCDIDHFKRVNDGFGHDVGDVVLQMSAEVLKSLAASRPSARIARFGGEEFVVLLPAADLAEAQSWAEAARLRLAGSRARTSRGPIAVTASFGVAAERFGGDMAALIARADAAMYSAKNAGRNRVAARPLAAAA